MFYRSKKIFFNVLDFSTTTAKHWNQKKHYENAHVPLPLIV